MLFFVLCDSLIFFMKWRIGKVLHLYHRALGFNSIKNFMSEVSFKVQRWYEYVFGHCTGDRLFFRGDSLVGCSALCCNIIKLQTASGVKPCWNLFPVTIQNICNFICWNMLVGWYKLMIYLIAIVQISMHAVDFILT